MFPFFRFPSIVQILMLASLQPALMRVAIAEDPVNPFESKSLAAWTTMDGNPVPPGWECVDGVIHLKKEGKGSGHIVTKAEYGDFALSFEWKIAPGGNSGLKYRVRTYGSRTIGCEYQIYDDTSEKKVAPRNSAAALYDLYEPKPSKKLKPVGEWNEAKIIVQGNRIEHWLNGEKVVDATVGDNEWNKRMAESKFSEYENFSKQPKGKLMLTDHGSEVWYRKFSFEAR